MRFDVDGISLALDWWSQFQFMASNQQEVIATARDENLIEQKIWQFIKPFALLFFSLLVMLLCDSFRLRLSHQLL